LSHSIVAPAAFQKFARKISTLENGWQEWRECPFPATSIACTGNGTLTPPLAQKDLFGAVATVPAHHRRRGFSGSVGASPVRYFRRAAGGDRAAPKLASGLHSPLAVHIGVATGEVIASSVGSQHHRGYTVTGEAANIAARLLEKATSGETLVSDAVYEATNANLSHY
jgi:hypothetical protein